jgi:hypothetical protein
VNVLKGLAGDGEGFPLHHGQAHGRQDCRTPPGGRKLVQVGRIEIGLFNVDGRIHACAMSARMP